MIRTRYVMLIIYCKPLVYIKYLSGPGLRLHKYEEPNSLRIAKGMDHDYTDADRERTPLFEGYRLK